MISFSRFSRGTPYSFAKISRFSSTLSSRSVVSACGMTPIDSRTPFAFFVTSNPLTNAVPDVGGNSVVIMRMRVDLPAPFGPSSPKISPSATSNVMPLTASKSPNFLTMFLTSMAPIYFSGSWTYAVMPTASRRSRLSVRSRTSNVLMSRLVRLTSRCVANPASAPR